MAKYSSYTSYKFYMNETWNIFWYIIYAKSPVDIQTYLNLSDLYSTSPSSKITSKGFFLHCKLALALLPSGPFILQLDGEQLQRATTKRGQVSSWKEVKLSYHFKTFPFYVGQRRLSLLCAFLPSICWGSGQTFFQPGGNPFLRFKCLLTIVYHCQVELHLFVFKTFMIYLSQILKHLFGQINKYMYHKKPFVPIWNVYQSHFNDAKLKCVSNFMAFLEIFFNDFKFWL